MHLKIIIILGSVRTGRYGMTVTKFIKNKCEQRGWKTVVIDPREWKLPLLNKMYKSYNHQKAPVKLKKLAQILKKADGFIIVSPEYNHSIPPALSNTMDFFMDEYFWRPSAIITYSTGSFGGVRVLSQLRSFLGELGMITIPSSLPIPKVHLVFDKRNNPLDQSYQRRANKLLDEFSWYCTALKKQKKLGTPY